MDTIPMSNGADNRGGMSPEVKKQLAQNRENKLIEQNLRGGRPAHEEEEEISATTSGDPSLPRLVVTIPEAAKMVGMSTASFYRLLAAEEFGPDVITKRNRKLIRMADMHRWVEMGMPDRATWLARQTQA